MPAQAWRNTKIRVHDSRRSSNGAESGTDVEPVYSCYMMSTGARQHHEESEGDELPDIRWMRERRGKGRGKSDGKGRGTSYEKGRGKIGGKRRDARQR